MYYYILDDNNTIINSIAITDRDVDIGVAYVRSAVVYAIGDTYDPASEPSPDPSAEERIAALESQLAVTQAAIDEIILM